MYGWDGCLKVCIWKKNELYTIYYMLNKINNLSSSSNRLSYLLSTFSTVVKALMCENMYISTKIYHPKIKADVKM